MLSLLKNVNINKIVLIIGFIIFILYGVGKDLRQFERAGDSAIFEQILDNIANNEGSVSNVFANTQYYIENNIGKTPINLIEENKLIGPKIEERDMLKFHAYYILYPLSLFSKIMDSSLFLSILQSLTFFGLLVIVYFFISSKSSNLAAFGFIFFIILNPNWYGGIQGLFYPDRLFLIVSVLFCIALYEKSIKFLIILSLVMILLNERAALVSGIVLIFYLITPSIYKEIKSRNLFDIKVLIVALILIIYAYLAKNYLLENLYYGNYLPSNLHDLLERLKLPNFLNNIEINFINNFPLIILLMFSKRFILGALFIWLLNIFGNVGGAEKIGWTTHYHSYYFPIMIFAASIGYINIIQKIKLAISDLQAKIIKFSVAIFIIVLFIAHQEYKINSLDISPFNSFKRNYITLVEYFKNGYSGYEDKYMLWKNIEKNTLVSTTEFGMAMLYQNNKVSVFPIDIDKADYVFIPSDYESKYLNIDNQKINFLDWLESKHFDTKNVIKIDKFTYSIFKKIENN